MDEILTDLEPGDAGWIVMRHGALYAVDEGYGPAFEALVARTVADFLERRDPARERAWIARVSGRTVGSVLLAADPDGWARLRCFLVEPEMRGTGLAVRMFHALTSFSREAGYPGLRLRTHESHRAAGRLYAREGMALVASAPVTAFGQATAEQVWELRLQAPLRAVAALGISDPVPA
jgi:GNAT superfamily N-acetyltransferase